MIFVGLSLLSTFFYYYGFLTTFLTVESLEEDEEEEDSLGEELSLSDESAFLSILSSDSDWDDSEEDSLSCTFYLAASLFFCSFEILNWTFYLARFSSSFSEAFMSRLRLTGATYAE